VDVKEKDYIREYLLQSLDSLNAFANDGGYLDVLLKMGCTIADSMRRGGKLLVAGNGGSAGDSQHIAGEFVSRLMFNRAPLPAVALTVDTSVITAVGNDFGFEAVFERQVRALGRPGDVFLGISTSGASSNILKAFAAAHEQGLQTLGFTGAVNSSMHLVCDHLLSVPSRSTPIIQQIHIIAAHVVCALVERDMFPEQAS
jgi:D-sedoheptulose 7-phosphate isomerase